jgi:hypothetical protein
VFTDHSIMGNYPTEGTGQADVRQRHCDQIHALNRDRIKDPNLILPGWELKLP